MNDYTTKKIRHTCIATIIVSLLAAATVFIVVTGLKRVDEVTARMAAEE